MRLYLRKNTTSPMNFLLFDDSVFAAQLQPFTHTRPISHIRCGIFTPAERWRHSLKSDGLVCASGIAEKCWPKPAVFQGLILNSAWIPTREQEARVLHLAEGEALVSGSVVLAWNTGKEEVHLPENLHPELCTLVQEVSDPQLITRPWHIFSLNGKVIRQDFERLSEGRKSAAIQDPFTKVYAPENVFVEEGVDIKAAIINASEGPVYIGKNAQIQEGSMIKGPFAMLESSVVNMGGKMRPDTTIGPFSKVGGEINNAVIFGYSNKAHDGFLGNSVIGEWCNLGADTNNSNLKNNYAEVKIWSYAEEKSIPTGLQFCGLLMADHSKCGINTMFNTGTVVGVACNLFDAGFPPTHIPAFTWGGAVRGFETYRIDKFLEAEERVYARRNKKMEDGYKDLLQHVFVRELAQERL